MTIIVESSMFLQPVSLFKFYLDRWPVEPVPLVAKQMLGLHRQFVSTCAIEKKKLALPVKN